MKRIGPAAICFLAATTLATARPAAARDQPRRPGGPSGKTATPAPATGEGRDIGHAAAGPVFDLPDGLGVERQEVHLSLHSVRLTYVFRSSGRRNVHFDFVMPAMPVDASPDAIGVAGGDETAGRVADTRPVNYLNLSVRVNDRPLALAGRGRALREGRDVTRQLRDAGVPLLYDIDGEAPWDHLSPAVRTTLEAGGLGTSAGVMPPASSLICVSPKQAASCRSSLRT